MPEVPEDDEMPIGNNSAARLKSYCERVERLVEDKKGISDDIKDIKAEAKGCGFDVKTLNEMLRLRAMDANKRQEQEALRDTYMAALDLI